MHVEFLALQTLPKSSLLQGDVSIGLKGGSEDGLYCTPIPSMYVRTSCPLCCTVCNTRRGQGLFSTAIVWDNSKSS